MKKNNKIKIKYESEADVLSWEISPKKAIDFASEIEDIVIHFSKDYTPVLVEILNASKFFTKARTLIKKETKTPVFVT